MDNKIRVVLRSRPFSSKEKEELKCSTSSWILDKHEIKHVVDSKTIGSPYVFDRVFLPEETTECVYNEICQPIVEAAMTGINGTIFAYGQTSSGKTYTMMGTYDNPGIIPQVVQGIFNAIENTPDREFLLRVSCMEIYNEIVVDLLQKKSKKDKNRASLKIHQDAEGNTYVSSLTEWTVTCPSDLMKCMEKGQRHRTVAETHMNDASSRSHSIFRVIIESRAVESIQTGTDYAAVTVSQLNLVDLAGSERSGQLGEIGDRLKEGCSINRSLFALGQVIGALSEGSDGPNKQYVNYRESKLTRILQPALGGNSMTVIICTITPASIQESHSTLRFATRAKKITNKPKINEVRSGEAEMQRFEKEIAILQKKLEDFTTLNEELQSGSEKKMQEMEKALAEKNELNLLLAKQVREMNAKLVVSSLRVQPNLPLGILKESRRLTWCGERVTHSPLKRRRLQPLLPTTEETFEGESISSKQQDNFEGGQNWCLDGDSYNVRNPFSTDIEMCDAAVNTDQELGGVIDHRSCLLKIENLMTLNEDLKKDRDGCLKEYKELQEFTRLEKAQIDLSTQNISLAKSLTSMETLLRDSNKNLSELKQENSELRCNLSKTSDELATLQRQMSKKEVTSNQNAELEKEVAELKKSLSHFENVQRDCDFKMEMQSLKFKSREADLCAQLEDAYKNLNKHGNGVCKMDSQFPTIFTPDHGLSSLADQLSVAEEKIHSLEAQLLAKKEEHDMKIQNLATMCSSLNDAMRLNLDNVQNENESTSKIVIKYSDAKPQMDAIVKLLNADLAELCEENPLLSNSMQTLQANFRRRSREMHDKSEKCNLNLKDQQRDEELPCESEFKGLNIDSFRNVDVEGEADQCITDVKLWSLEMGMLASATEKELLEEVLSLRAKCANFEDKCQGVQEKDLLLNPMREACVECSQLEAEVLRLHDAEKSLKLKLDELNLLRQESEQMLTELRTLRPLPSQVESLQSDLEAVRKVYDEQFHEATRCAALVQSLQIDKDLLHSEKETISKTLEETLQEMALIKGGLSLLNDHVQKAISENELLNEGILSKQKEIISLTEQNDQLKKELNLSTSAGQLVSLESMREEFGQFLNAKLAEQESQFLREKQEEIAEVERNLRGKMNETIESHVGKEREKVTAELNCVQQERAAEFCAKEKQMLEDTILLQAIIGRLKLELQEKSDQLNSLIQESNQICAANSILEERRCIDEKCQEILGLNSDIAAKLAEISHLKVKVLQQEMEMSEAKKQYGLEIEMLTKQKDDLETKASEVAMLTSQRDDLETKLSNLQSSLTCAADKLLDCQRKSELTLLSLSEKHNSELQSTLEKHSAGTSQLQQNLLDWKNKAAKLEASLYSMKHLFQSEKASLQLELESLRNSQNSSVTQLETINTDLRQQLAQMQQDVISMKQKSENDRNEFEVRIKELMISHELKVSQLQKTKEDLQKSCTDEIRVYVNRIRELKCELEKEQKCATCETFKSELARLKLGYDEKDKLLKEECQQTALLKEEIRMKTNVSQYRDGKNSSLNGFKGETEKLKAENAELQEKLEKISAELDRMEKFCDAQTKEFEEYSMDNVESKARLATYEKIINAVKQENEIQAMQNPIAVASGTDVHFSKEAVNKFIFPLIHYENLLRVSKHDCKALTLQLELLRKHLAGKQIKIAELEADLEKSKMQAADSDPLAVSQLKQRVAQLEHDKKHYKNELRRLQLEISEPTVPVVPKNSASQESSKYDCLNYGSGIVNSVILMEMKEERLRMEKKIESLELTVDKHVNHIRQLKKKLVQYKTRLESVMQIVDNPTTRNLKMSSMESSQPAPLSVLDVPSIQNKTQLANVLTTPPRSKTRSIIDTKETPENSPPKRSRFPDHDDRFAPELTTVTTPITLSPESQKDYEKCKVQ